MCRPVMLASMFTAVIALSGIPTWCLAAPEGQDAHISSQAVMQPPAHLTVTSALPGPLANGVAVIPFRVEQLKIVPVYGEAALAVSPRIGHLHITVDDAPWHWLHSSDESIVVQGLVAGPHHVLLELADANHRLIESKMVSFEIPQSRPSH